MNVLELQSLTRVFERGERALDRVDLTLAPAAVVGLLGRNGAGKTTLIRVALGMLHAQEGRVRVFGRDPARFPVEVKRRLGYVSEDQVLPPHLRVDDVLALHADLFPTWDVDLEVRLANDFELPRRTRIARLSKGQARRVALLCALAHRPELLVLDEPAGGLDPAARRELLQTALHFLGQEGTAILFSSHQMEDVERLASRVAILEKGRLVVDRELDALRETTLLLRLPATVDATPESVGALEGCLRARRVGTELHALFTADRATLARRLEPLHNGHEPRLSPLTLEELFIELVGGRAE